MQFINRTLGINLNLKDVVLVVQTFRLRIKTNISTTQPRIQHYTAIVPRDLPVGFENGSALPARLPRRRRRRAAARKIRGSGLTLILRWDGNPTRPDTANFQITEYY